MSKSYTRFRDISVSEKILNTGFLLNAGLGYLVALGNLYYPRQGRDGVTGLSIKDVIVNYRDSNDQTRLWAVINGIMGPKLKYKNDKDMIRFMHNFTS